MFRVNIKSPNGGYYYLTEEGGITDNLQKAKRFVVECTAWGLIDQVRGRYKGFNLLFGVECIICTDWDPSDNSLPAHNCLGGRYHPGDQSTWDILGFHSKS